MKIIDFYESGRILQVMELSFDCSLDDLPHIDNPVDATPTQRIEVSDETEVTWDGHYILHGVVVARPTWTPIVSTALIPADGQTPITVDQIPATAAVEVLGPILDSWSESSGQIDLTVDIPGRYTIRVSPFPYQDVEVKFDAT